MINVHCDKKGIKMIVAGDIPEIGTDLTHIINGICEKLDEQSPEIGLRFKLSFMMAFNDGLIFNTDAKGMKKLNEILDDYTKNHKDDDDDDDDDDDPASGIDALLDKLIEVRNELKEAREKLEKQVKDAEKGEGKHETK